VRNHLTCEAMATTNIRRSARRASEVRPRLQALLG
jgi:hypothetical protein